MLRFKNVICEIPDEDFGNTYLAGEDLRYYSIEEFLIEDEEDFDRLVEITGLSAEKAMKYHVEEELWPYFETFINKKRKINHFKEKIEELNKEKELN